MLMLEKSVRSAFAEDSNITFKEGMELVGIEEDHQMVTVSYQDEVGGKHASTV
jgi:hypothetical protein